MEFPSAALGTAVFAALPGKSPARCRARLGSFVFKVTDVSSTALPPPGLRDQIRQQLQLQKAQADVAQDVDNLQDALAARPRSTSCPAISA